MDLTFTEEHQELRRAVRQFLEDHSGEEAVRAIMETESGYSPDVWTKMASEMGLQGLQVPEKHGGAGLGPVEMVVVQEEMGRALYCGPYFSSAVLAVKALGEMGGDGAGDLLQSIASGETIATVAWAEEGQWRTEGFATRAEKGKISGTKDFVIDGAQAHVLLVLASDGGSPALFRVDADAAGLERENLPTFDLTRRLARVTFDATPAVRVGTGDVGKVLAEALTALSAEQAGVAQRCLEMSTEYAKTRFQFGRPIGSFQAVKHRCANLLLEAEFAKSAAYAAGFESRNGGDPLAAAHLAKAYGSEAAVHAAHETIQVHGGMGFTWEHPAHLYLKRAKGNAELFGSAGAHREKLAALLGI